MSDMKNTTCKACGSRYHICSNCDSGGVEFMYDGYCSQKCYDTLSLVERLRLECEDEAADEIERLREIERLVKQWTSPTGSHRNCACKRCEALHWAAGVDINKHQAERQF